VKASWRNLALLGLVWLATACAGAQPSTPLPSALAQEATGEAIQKITPAQAERYATMRQQMVATTIEARGVEDEGVLEAMRSVPRHLFVPERFEDQAYGDHPLPIGYGQTISQPYIVASMTELLDLQPGEKVLEIGTGSGYQAAVLAELEDIQVYSVEIVPELAESAQARLHQLGYDQVQVMQGDGYYGWEEHAPYNAILVTAAPDHLPSPLVDQLAAGGRLVIPIGPPGGYQTLWQFAYEEGELQAHNLGEVSFVPFTGEGISR
jgi:protein-L-isoaspartate(D-aspartate) O-methyltransferase